MDAAHPLVIASSWTAHHAVVACASITAGVAAWYARRRLRARTIASRTRAAGKAARDAAGEGWRT